MKINNISEWNKFLPTLIEGRYSPWQYQFSVDSPEGLHVGFISSTGSDLLIVTHSHEVKDAIEKFRVGKF